MLENLFYLQKWSYLGLDMFIHKIQFTKQKNLKNL